MCEGANLIISLKRNALPNIALRNFSRKRAHIIYRFVNGTGVCPSQYLADHKPYNGQNREPHNRRFFIVLGLFAFTTESLEGGILQMVNHGLSTGLLFLLIGMIYERRHTRAIADFGGVALSMPIFAFFFIVSMLSSVGLPGLNGFVGEFMILLGSFEASPLWGTIGVTGVIFGAIYLLSATRRVLFGPLTRKENEELQDLNLREVGLMVPLVVLCFWIGFKPNDFLSELDGSIDALVVRIEAAETQLELAETALLLDDSTPDPAVALVEAAQ